MATLQKDKETKNTIRFVGKDGAADITVYVQKSDPRSSGDSLEVTVGE